MRSRRISLAWLLLLACAAVSAQSIRILVQSSPLAGFQYHAGAVVWDDMQVGDALTLVREPENPHDANAVRIDWRGQQIGYLPRVENGAVAAEMDRGGRLEARIAKLRNHRDPRQRVLVDVHLVM